MPEFARKRAIAMPILRLQCPAKASVTGVLAAILLGALTMRPAAASDQPGSERSFIFHYNAVVSDMPAGSHRVEVWIPLPKSDSNQVIEHLSVAAPGRYTVHTDPERRNSILHFSSAPPADGRLSFALTFRVLRRETGLVADPRPPGNRFLAANRLVPLSGPILDLARQATQGKNSDLEKARAIYDFVTSYMTYDKTGAGWGRGDALRACEIRRGNCTDFHALLIGMARSVGIPARFKIGFPVPADSQSGQISGYHCWAELYIKGKGWLPVDSSEASKHPQLRDYYFGRLDPNRVEFTEGRDIRLVPRQAGPPLNYFIYPYAEVDGKPHDVMQLSFTFEPTAAPAKVAGQAGAAGS